MGAPAKMYPSAHIITFEYSLWSVSELNLLYLILHSFLPCPHPFLFFSPYPPSFSPCSPPPFYHIAAMSISRLSPPLFYPSAPFIVIIDSPSSFLLLPFLPPSPPIIILICFVLLILFLFLFTYPPSSYSSLPLWLSGVWLCLDNKAVQSFILPDQMICKSSKLYNSYLSL